MHDPTNHTDEELVALSIQNKLYFGELVTRYERKLGEYIYRIGTLPQEDIEDLLQNIFLRVYQNLNAFNQDLQFSSWIYRIAHNETMAFFRKKKVRPQGHLQTLTDDEMANVASELNITRDLEARDDATVLHTCIQKLPQQYQEILVLKFFEHKSYDELSDILELPQGTVAIRIRRAKERLRKLLNEHGYE
ncbi:sigma-70 family RNA polymerase sigma factor [Patescibacteria group bacterium]|nr:sigma-70 family RNA polymerase sigma factor [Patescibacteria group bacterium]